MNNERLCDHTLFMRSILVFLFDESLKEAQARCSVVRSVKKFWGQYEMDMSVLQPCIRNAARLGDGHLQPAGEEGRR